jgi:hypothetical protein
LRDYHEDLATHLVTRSMNFAAVETSMWGDNLPEPAKVDAEMVQMDADYESLAEQVEKQDFRRDTATTSTKNPTQYPKFSVAGF